MSKKKNRKNKFGNTIKRNKVVQTPTDKNSTNKTTTVTSYNWKNAYKEPHIYKGVKNKTEFTEFVALCKLTQNELKDMLPKKLLESGYKDVISSDGFIYARGEMPILLTAHMDTVHKIPVIDFYEYVDAKGNHIISSPQGIGGDDRCGVYMILEIIKEYKPYILFCEDEEIGGIGSGKFCRTDFIDELEDMKFLIELDRANKKDAVFYDCDNKEFTKFIEDTTGFVETWGTFSDISNLAPQCNVAAVNLSCGYYHAHSLEEEVNMEEMLHTVEMVKVLLNAECEQFEYVKKKRTYYGDGYSYGYGYGYYGRYYDDYENYDDYYWRNGYSQGKSYSGNVYNYPKETKKHEDKTQTPIIYITFIDPETNKEMFDSRIGETIGDAWFNFFQEYPNVCWNLVLDYEIDYVLS